MNAGNMTPGDWDALLVTFAAELTNAAYRVVLQHGRTGSWVDLELDLWKVLAERVQEWGTAIAAGRIAGALDTTTATCREESTYAHRKNHTHRRPGRPS
jgi:hypothetical protein